MNGWKQRLKYLEYQKSSVEVNNEANNEKQKQDYQKTFLPFFELFLDDKEEGQTDNLVIQQYLWFDSQQV